MILKKMYLMEAVFCSVETRVKHPVFGFWFCHLQAEQSWSNGLTSFSLSFVLKNGERIVLTAQAVNSCNTPSLLLISDARVNYFNP